MNKINKIKKASEKKYIPMLAFFIALLMLGNVFVYADANENTHGSSDDNISYFEIGEDTIGVTFSIGNYDIVHSEYGDELTVENFGRLLVPGKPNIPSKIFSIAIPPGAEFVDFTYDTTEKIVLEGKYNIKPTDNPIVIGEQDPEVNVQMQLDYDENYQSTYGKDDPYPASAVEYVQSSGFRKYNLVDIRVNPFSYNPASAVLTFHPEITVIISYTYPEGFDSSDIMTDNIVSIEQKAEKIICNYDQTEDWYPETPNSKELYDYVIITLDSLTTNIDSLVNWEAAKGRSVNVVTTSWISSNYAGYDLAEKIRNLLIDKYPSGEWGILDVCIIGHWDDVPIRTCSQYYYGYGPPDSDFYYAELSLPDSQSWDANGNHLWAEDSDPIDFIAEVNVGRIPWSNPQIVEDICDKTVAYEQNNDASYKKNILLLGAFFWYDTDNAVLMEYKTDSGIHPWMTNWTMTKMYEVGDSSYPCDYNLDYNNVETVWSQGTYAFVNWAGHGSEYACYEYYPSQAFIDTDTCDILNDNYPAIVFADACSNSDTDYLNIGQAMLKQGAVGFLGSTKVAFGMHAWNDPTDGSSQSLDYFFTTCCTSGDYTQGEAHQWSLYEMYSNNYWYNSKFEALEWGALWGNPDIGMESSGGSNLPPNTPDTPIGPDEGETGVEYIFTTTTTDPENDDVYYMWNWGNEISEWFGPYNSDETVEIPHTWDQPGEFNIKVKAKDESGYESSWSDAIAINIIGVPQLEIGEITGGFGITAEIKNVGSIEALNVEWKIQLDGLVFIGKEKTGTFEKIMPGFEPSAETGFVFGIGPIDITVTADDKQKTTSGFIIGPFVLM